MEASKIQAAPSTESSGAPGRGDAEVVARVLGGEARDYALLVDRYQRRLHWTCLRLLGDADEADDVVQEAFVRAYDHLSDYDPGFRFYTWIFRIARNLALNRLRRRRLWGFLSLSGPGAPEPEAVDDSGSAVEGRELAEALAACLEGLPGDQRECFRLRHAEDFSYAEIAATLGVPQGTVMSRLSRAREKMRRCIESKGVTFG